MLITFGYPADEGALEAPPRTGGRRPLSETVHFERW
jgi:nitroreductase